MSTLKINQAVSALKNGELVILPTETVYGIFAVANNQDAVEKLYKIKGRPKDKALNLNVSTYEEILKYSINQPSYLKKLVDTFLPGALTIILQASSQVPSWIHEGKTTVGFRMPAMKITQGVIVQTGTLVGPSANLTGQPSPIMFTDISNEILQEVSLALQDDGVYGQDSTIIDLSGQEAQILRQGQITKEEIVKKVPELNFGRDSIQ